MNRTRSRRVRSASMMPLMPSPGRPKTTSTPQSISASTSTSDAVCPMKGTRRASPMPLAARREILDGLVRWWPGQVDALRAGGVASPVRVVEVSARQDAEVRAPGGEDRVDVGVRGDVANGHRRDSRLVTDAIAEGRLEEAATRDGSIGHGVAGRDVDDVAAVRLQR